MKEAFPDYPIFSGMKGPRAFALPQQNYLVAFCLLEQCKADALQQFERDFSPEERAHMTRRAYAEKLESYRCRGYDDLLTLFFQAERQLVDWGIRQMQQDVRTPPEVLEALTQQDHWRHHPRLMPPFVEICLRFVPKEEA